MKNNNSWSIAFACAFGALIGSLVSLEITARFAYGSYMWIIGALVGGCVAYITIDFRHFCAGVSHSFRRTIAWRPYGLYWRAFGSAFVASAAMAPTITTALTTFLVIVAASSGSLSKNAVMDIIAYATLGVVGFSVVLAPLVGIIIGLNETSKRAQESEEARANRLNHVIRANLDFARKINLVAVSIASVRCVLSVMRYCIVHTPAAATATGLFIKKVSKTIGLFVARVFVYVHSTRRTICFVDAAIGSAIGYYFGSAIVGSIAGALLGVINYEIVSVRWLRLVPASR